jgi:hypothetical protein
MSIPSQSKIASDKPRLHIPGATDKHEYTGRYFGIAAKNLTRMGSLIH